jgi:hypothetical protein
MVIGCTGKVSTVRYVDASQGDDANDGKTPQTAWRSLDKLNAHEFGPGATILFKSGEEWNGELVSRGSGDKDNTVRLDRYGEGEKPAIHGTGGLYTIYLSNQEYWEISNLELTNFKREEETMDPDTWEAHNASWWAETDTVRPKYSEDRTRKCAILVEVEDFGAVHYLHFTNLEIHGVNGDITSKDNGGIFLHIKGDLVPTYFEGLLVADCHINDVDRTGVSNKSTWMHRPPRYTNDNWVPAGL